MSRSETQYLSTPDQAARVAALLEERKEQAVRSNRAKIDTVPKPEPQQMTAFVLEGPSGVRLRAFLGETGARLFWDSAGLCIDVYSDRVVDFDHKHSTSDVALYADAERLIRELEAMTVALLPPRRSGLL